jgi:hypothetical protein
MRIGRRVFLGAMAAVPTATPSFAQEKRSPVLRTVIPDDFDSIQHAIETGQNVEARAGAKYHHTGVALGNSQSFDGKNTSIIADAGENIYVLSGYAPTLERIYIVDNTASREAAIHIGTSRFADVRRIFSPNTGNGGLVVAANQGFVALTELDTLTFEGITGTGISIGSSVVEIFADNVYCAGKLDTQEGRRRPYAGTVGWRQKTPIVDGHAVGGHQIFGCNMIAVETGWWLTDAQLSRFNSCIADSTRGYGVVIDGSSDRITFVDLFVGASMGIRIGGAARNISFDILETALIGVPPPWGQAPFYNHPGPYFAITVEDTAKVTINGDSWRGDKRVSVAPTASLTVTGGFWFQGRNAANIAAGTTTYLADREYLHPGDAMFRAPYDGYLFQAKATLDRPPGPGQTATFVVQLDGVDTAMKIAVSGASSLSGLAYGPISVKKDQFVTLKLEKSDGMASGGRYHFDLQMLGI